MPRTSPLYYIAPSAVSIIANANGSANDLAVYIARGTKIKVYCPAVGIDMDDALFKEWTLEGRNRRLADSEKPYTIYARLGKSDTTNGYLVFAPKVSSEGVWIDKYKYLTRDGLSKDGASADVNYWYVKMGEVSEPNAGIRSLDFDTGILGTDQYNSEWALNPDDFPLRVEVDCSIDGEPAGSYPYVDWGQQVRMSAVLMEGFSNISDLSRIDHFEITRHLGEAGSIISGDNSEPEDWPDAQRKASFRTSGNIALYHDRDGIDDFAGAEAAMFTVVAWGEQDESSSSSDSSNAGTLVPKATATVTLHAKTYNVVTADDLPEDLDEYTPDDTSIMSGAAVSAYIENLDKRFLRKDLPDTPQTVEGDVEFEKDVEIAEDLTIGSYREHTAQQTGQGAKVFSDGTVHGFGAVSKFRTVVFGDYVQGMIAGAQSGARIEESGDARFKSVSISEFLEVPEIRFNRATVSVGIGLRSTGGGIIEDVIQDSATTGRCALKLEDGEYGAIDLDDLCLGFWHNEPLPGQASGNASADFDPKNGDYELKGFQSIYFRIDGFYATEEDYLADTNVITDTTTARGANKYFHYALRGNAYGNVPSTAVRKTWNNHPKAQLHFGQIGNSTNTDRQNLLVTTPKYDLRLEGLTTWNYNSSNIIKIEGDLDGFTMQSRRWDGSQWVIYDKSFAGNGVVLGNAYIYGQIDQFERAAFRCYVDQSYNGAIAPRETETETVTILNGYGEDVTSQFTKFSVTRDSGDSASDAVWNASHQNVGNPFQIAFSDLGIDGITRLSTLFYVTATDEVNDITSNVATMSFSS